jgi:hypothetical protein
MFGCSRSTRTVEPSGWLQHEERSWSTTAKKFMFFFALSLLFLLQSYLRDDASATTTPKRKTEHVFGVQCEKTDCERC